MRQVLANHRQEWMVKTRLLASMIVFLRLTKRQKRAEGELNDARLNCIHEVLGELAKEKTTAQGRLERNR